MSSSPSSATATDHARALHDVQVLQRRICLLRQQGDGVNADRLETQQLNPAVQGLLTTGHLPHERLQEMLLVEENRVRDAALLAELIAPLLRPSFLRETAAETSRQPARDAHALPASPRRVAPDGIAAFIDDMLAQAAASRRG